MRFYRTIFVDAIKQQDGTWVIDGQFRMTDADFMLQFIPVKDAEFEIPQLEQGNFLVPVKYKADK